MGLGGGVGGERMGMMVVGGGDGDGGVGVWENRWDGLVLGCGAWGWLWGWFRWGECGGEMLDLSLMDEVEGWFLTHLLNRKPRRGVEMSRDDSGEK
ncbi:hypothetical protein Tco_1384239 [Tanacetum coccineum]